MARSHQFIFMALGGDTAYPTSEHEIQLCVNNGALRSHRCTSHDAKCVFVFFCGVSVVLHSTFLLVVVF
jgi:hypothetical protein